MILYCRQSMSRIELQKCFIVFFSRMLYPVCKHTNKHTCIERIRHKEGYICDISFISKLGSYNCLMPLDDSTIRVQDNLQPNCYSTVMINFKNDSNSSTTKKQTNSFKIYKPQQKLV